MSTPTPAAVLAYLGDTSVWDEAAVTAALSAEAAVMAHHLNLPDESEDWPADLAEALFRRVAHNLAVRALPLGVQPSVDGVSSAIRVGGYDPEVSRLEGPFRKVIVR